MMHRPYETGTIAHRARRSVREIALAIALTLAAVIFVVAAVHNRTTPETAAISPPAAAPTEQSN